MSLENTITLPVDLANTGTTTDKEYTNISRNGNISTYKCIADSTDRLRSLLQFYRTPATRNGNFMGSQKGTAKFTVDREVPGVDASSSVIAPSIMSLSFSTPVGVSEAHRLEDLQRLIALADLDAIMSLFMNHLIT